VVFTRDTKDCDGAVLAFSPMAWQGFTTGIKEGQFGRAAR
jgi:hypothetical protein